LLGHRGNKKEALAKIDDVIQNGFYRKLDAVVLKALLQAWKGQPKEAIRFFEGLGKDYPENFLIDINIAAIYQDKLKDRRAALNTYQRLLSQIDQKADGVFPGEIHYRIGKVHSDLMEYSKALVSLENGLKEKCREPETIPLCHYQIALIHEEQGDKEQSRKHYSDVLDYKGPLLSKEMKRAKKKTK